MRGRSCLCAVLLLVAHAQAFMPSSPFGTLPRLRPSSCAVAMAGGFGSKPAAGKPKGGKKKPASVPERAPQSAVAPAVVESDKVGMDLKRILDGIDEEQDPFWQLIGPLLQTEFPPSEIERVMGFIKYSTKQLPLPDDIVLDKWRPHEDIHAFMAGIPATQFRDTSNVPFIQELEANYEAIALEFEALVKDPRASFQSVTSMNYDSGWKTLVLYFNGHRIEGFPYETCPITTAILDKVPVAGRIAGFNRQKPNSGIPLHSDGNNMWLTCQMGIKVPKGQKAWIRVGDETRRWTEGKCLLYDTTFEHETFNESEEEERVVLHIDFWNFLDLSPTEVKAMQRVYELREMFLRAEGLIETGGKL
ncbi:Aspartyl/Asparaginyl beta-hydroxylase-domain-containing protein [Baffinella frigidus]|nr:Aspartyl/Asparaginyl beta-hydroxylase-domain-containing protein [Cryptophyta sp. CCMP2293]